MLESFCYTLALYGLIIALSWGYALGAHTKQ